MINIYDAVLFYIKHLFSNYNPKTSSISITWELVMNANSWVHLTFIPKLTNIWTSNTEDSFCLFLNYIKVTWHNLWDCPTFSTKCPYQLTHPTAVYESFTRPTSFPTSETENLLKFKSLSGCVWM